MSYFGYYLGAVETVVVEVPAAATPDPIESPIETSSPEFVDHLALALSRLCQYAKPRGN